MNTRIQRRSEGLASRTPLSAISACVLGLGLMAGCSSTGYVKSNVTAWNLQAGGAAARAESRTLQETTVALADLVNTPAGDLRLQFQRFSRALDELVSSKKQADRTVGRLDQKSAAYFAAWDRQLLVINDEDLRKRSEARKVEVRKQCETTSRHYQETQGALTPLIGYLLDIRKVLSTDLTLAGLQAVKPPFTSASDKAAGVQTQLTQLAAELDSLGEKMCSFGSQVAQ